MLAHLHVVHSQAIGCWHTCQAAGQTTCCCPQLILLRDRVMPEFPDHDYYLWLDGDAAIIDHNLDIRLIPQIFPGGHLESGRFLQPVACVVLPCWGLISCPGLRLHLLHGSDVALSSPS